MAHEDDALPRVTRTGSLAEQAYAALRASIADGRLAPGTRVTERGLAGALDVSPTPVREAIRKLEHEGLLERVGARGLQVVDHPSETLSELMEVEVMLRGAEARFAARKISPEVISQMQEWVDEVARSGDRMSAEDKFALAQRFDAEVARAAANPALRALIESYAIYGDARLGRARVDAARPEWVARRVDAHREMVAALAAHDEDEAERLMRGNARSSLRDL